MVFGRLRNNECKLKEERYRLNRRKTFFAIILSRIVVLSVLGGL